MPRENDNSPQPLVVLIHGLSASRFMMWPLSLRIRRAGFKTRSFGYPSCFLDIKRHGLNFHSFLTTLAAEECWSEIHIVAHSMGGIVTREALCNRAPEKVRRLVLLTTPHQGSPAARILSYTPLRLIKAFPELSDVEDSYVNSMPPLSGFETGNMAASYDFVVREPSSHTSEETDHVRIFSGHNGVLVRPRAARLVIAFLKTGKFRQQDATMDES